MGRRPSPKRKRLKNTKENSSLLSIDSDYRNHAAVGKVHVIQRTIGVH
jgi:hypothetical protein